jgi:hypothetical protein
MLHVGTIQIHPLTQALSPSDGEREQTNLSLFCK